MNKHCIAVIFPEDNRDCFYQR